MAWYIKGEIGRALDDTMREISSLGIDGATVEFGSLAADKFQWSACTQDATGAGTIVPDVGQIVELYKDADRKFRGHVLAPKISSHRVAVTAEGPWWWMSRIPLTSDQVDSVGGTAERCDYVFSTGSHKSKLQALISRAIVNGCPMLLGTVAECYDTPNMSFSEMNCAQALAELMAWIPDAVAWFDHSGLGDPVLNISRRATMLPQGFTIGVDAVISSEISPRLDLEVGYSKLDYVTRHPTTGKPAWASQSSGTPAAGKKQILTISGPEISDILPMDDFDSMYVTSYPTIGPFLRDLNPDTKWLYDTHGISAHGNGGYSDFRVAQSGGGGSLGSSYSVSAASYPSGYKGIKFGPLGLDRPPDWIVKQLGLVQLSLGGHIGVTDVQESGAAALMRREAVNRVVGPEIYWFEGSSPQNYRAFKRLTDLVWLQPVGGPNFSNTLVYKKWDYDFLVPPAGLAAGLQAAQDWVPWEGPISLVQDDVSGDNRLGRKYNLAGTLPACATMGTLARSQHYDLFTGRETIELGAPARADFGTLTSRIRRQPRDNIVYL